MAFLHPSSRSSRCRNLAYLLHTRVGIMASGSSGPSYCPCVHLMSIMLACFCRGLVRKLTWGWICGFAYVGMIFAEWWPPADVGWLIRPEIREDPSSIAHVLPHTLGHQERHHHSIRLEMRKIQSTTAKSKLPPCLVLSAHRSHDGQLRGRITAGCNEAHGLR
jgi:hypothetical protein